MLEVKHLKILFPESGFTAVCDSSFVIKEGEILALVGESGSGKSLTALAILGLEPKNAMISGQINFNEIKLLNHSDLRKSFRRKYPKKIRGLRISYVPQDPLSSLNPMYTIYNQLSEAARVYDKKNSEKEVWHKCFLFLDKVGIADPQRTLKSYPHELSGGMRQRVMIAMALINNPDLIIADEATTALDVTVQANILRLLKSLNKTILFITHDLAVVAEIADRVLVMEKGQMVEEKDVFQIFSSPSSDYTKKLIAAVPVL